MKNRIFALLLAVLLLVGTAACGKKSDPAAERKANAELVVGIAQDLDESLDPHLTVSAGTREVMFNVFEGLLKAKASGDGFSPALAESVETENGGRTVRIRLREGVRFHNGESVTVEDVVWCFDRNRGAGGEKPLLPALSVIEAIERDGENGLVLTLSDPNPEFLSSLTFAIIPKDYDNQNAAPVGTGPYRFVSRKALDSIVLERNEDYWGEKPFMKKVTFRIIENAQGLLLGLQSGAIDLVSHLTVTQVKSLKKKDFDVAEGKMNLVQALYLNNAVKPLDDLRVRQALCCGLDRQKLLDVAFDGRGTLLGSSMYPAFTKYFDESLTNTYPFDPARAKELLKEAGYENGLTIEVKVPSNYKPHVDTAEVMKELYEPIGVTLEIRPVEWGVWVDEVYTKRDFEATVVGVDASSLTARAMLERFVSDYAKNFINYSNADYDALFAEAQAASDDATQTEAYLKMEKNLADNAASVYVQDLADMVALRKGLTGLTFYPVYVLDVGTLSWE